MTPVLPRFVVRHARRRQVLRRVRVPLAPRQVSPYLIFAGSFLGFSGVRHYLESYLRIFRSPVPVTYERYHTTTLHNAFRFLEYSRAIVLLLAISSFLVFEGNHLLGDFLLTTYFMLAHLVTFRGHYRLVAPRAEIRRSSSEFLRLTSILLGFTIPVSSALQAIRLAFPTAGALFLILLTVPLVAYAVIAWKRFRGIGAIRALFYLWISSLLGVLVGLASIFVVGVLFG